MVTLLEIFKSIITR